MFPLWEDDLSTLTLTIISPVVPQNIHHNIPSFTFVLCKKTESEFLQLQKSSVLVSFFTNTNNTVTLLIQI